jgi:hypothetical protein
MKYIFERDGREESYNSETGELTFHYTNKAGVTHIATKSIYDYSIVKVRSQEHVMWDCYTIYGTAVITNIAVNPFAKLFNLVYNAKCIVGDTKYKRITLNSSIRPLWRTDDDINTPVIIMSDEDLTKISMIMNVYEGRYVNNI